MDEIPGGKRGARQRNAVAVDRGVDQHTGAIEHRPVQAIAITHTRRLQPGRPGAVIVKVQEWVLEYVFRLFQFPAERWTANRK